MARKKGLEGYVRADGSPQPKEEREKVIEPVRSLSFLSPSSLLPVLSALSFSQIVDRPSISADAGLGGAWEDWEDCVKGCPGTIHVELMEKKRIKDPYLGRNEAEVQCEYLFKTWSGIKLFAAR